MTDKEDDKPINFNEYRNRPREEIAVDRSFIDITADGKFLKIYCNNSRILVNLDSIATIQDNTGNKSLPPRTTIIGNHGQELVSVTTNIAGMIWEVIYDARRRRR